MGGQIGYIGYTGSTERPNFNLDQSSHAFFISPAFGMAIRDNFIIGLDLSYFHSKYENTHPAIQKTDAYGIGFFVRQYKVLGKGFYLFGQARAGGSCFTGNNFDTYTQPTTDRKSKGIDLELGLYPGVAYTVSKRLQLEAGFNNLGYIKFSHTKSSETGLMETQTYNDLSMGSTLSDLAGFTVGFRVLLN